jgi:hypothetical protein
MATSVISSRRPKVQSDRIFYPAMCLLVLVTVWMGFAKSYYAAGLVHANLPSAIVHVHAIAFTLWLLTLVVQTTLVSVRKVKLHMSLGLGGFSLAAAMVVLGSLAAVDSLRRGMSPPWSGLSPEVFFVIPATDILLFAVLAAWAYAVRRRPDQHKRLIMIATISLLDAAIGRFPATVTPMGPLTQMIILFSFLAIMASYDVITRKSIHRVTWIASLIIIVVQVARVPLAQTASWVHFAHIIRG